MGPPRTHRRGPKPVLPCMFCFFSSSGAVGVIGELWPWLLMAPTCFQCARARLAPARARRVPCYLFSASTFNLIFFPFFLPSSSPPHVLPNPYPSPAPFRPGCQHPTTHRTTRSTRSLRSRHNRRRKLPLSRPLRPTLWYRVPPPPTTKGHLRLDPVT